MEKFMKDQCPDRYKSIETAFCDMCHGLLRASSHFYHCKECAYDICGNCFSAKDETAATTTQQQETELILESSHPYEHNLDEYISVEMSGASGYLISFDKNSSTEFAHDYIRFYKDDDHIDYWGQEMYSGGPSSSEKNFPGMDNRPPLVIPAGSFIVHFHSNKTGSDWGYKFTVKKCTGDSLHTGEENSKQSDTPTFCALDVDDLKSKQPGSGCVDDEMNIGKSMDGDITTTSYDPEQFEHTGEWREQSSLEYSCATDELSKGGSQFMCDHDGGIIKGNHWSCCGVQEVNARGCRNENGHKMVQGKCHICSLCAMCTGSCTDTKERMKSKKIYEQLQGTGVERNMVEQYTQSPDNYMKLLTTIASRQDDKGQECGCGKGYAGCVNCTRCFDCSRNTRCPGKLVSSSSSVGKNINVKYRDYETFTVTRNDATVPHLGEWRVKLDPKRGGFKCAMDEDSMAGSMYMCTHSGVISVSHWSCCGSENEDCPGCPADIHTEKSKTFESDHPYRNSMNEYIVVEIPDAVSYSVSFDSQTSMNGRSDFIRFFKNDEHKSFWGEEKYSGDIAGSTKNFPGCDGRPSLIIPSGRFIIHFYTDGSNDTDWGYKLTVSSSHSKGPHLGDWRDQSRLRYFCAVDEDTMGGGATQLCEHLEGVITASHWSCCGTKEFDSKECVVSIAGADNTNTKMISLLLDEGIDPSICNHEGNNALMIACDRGRFDAVKLILEKMPAAAINMTNKAIQVWWEKNIALTWKFVIGKNGKDITFPETSPSTLLCTVRASSEGNKKISWCFVMRGNDSWCVGVVPLKEEGNQKYLFENGKYGLSNSGLIGGKMDDANMHRKRVRMVMDAVALCLLICIDGEKERKFDMTPKDFPAGLGICGFKGSRCTTVNVVDINIVRLLLNKNIELDIPDQQGKTALVRAIENNQKDIVIELLQSDANLEVFVPLVEYRKFAVVYVLGEVFEDIAKKLIGASWWPKLFNEIGDLVILKTAIDKNWQDFISECIRAFQPFKGDSDAFDGPAELVWCYIVTLDNVYAPDVIFVLDKYLSRVRALADARDPEYRRAVDIAKPVHRKAIQDRLRFSLLLKRYEMNERALHTSGTCLVYIARDKEIADSNVALKFFQNRMSFEREIEVRNQGDFDPNYVLRYLHIHDGDVDNEFAKEASRKGLYPYCIVMPAAERSLFDIMTHELIPNDWNKLREITREIAAALHHVHSKGYVHGDIKPHNIMRIEGRYRLIDFDASAKFGHAIGMKTSPLYVPPEMVKRIEEERHCIRNVTEDSCIASTSYDMWSLGVTLFNLFTGKSLFHADKTDNIDPYSLKKLFSWNPSTMIKGDLDNITVPEARNLIGRLLSYDKSNRPDATRVLCHPFITGAKGGRMVGEAAKFDVFLSYRVWCDKYHVDALEQLLLDKGLRVWRDVNKLKDGENWRLGFCKGMANSRVIVLLLSRNAVNNPLDKDNINNCNFSMKIESSVCDNVLLEHRLALELSGMGLAEKIYPVMIGDIITMGSDYKSNEYDRYGYNGRTPHAPVPVNICVRAVELQLQSYLTQLGLGAPLMTNMTVKQVYNGITANQGCFIEGLGEQAFAKVADRIHKMVIELDKPAEGLSDVKVGRVEGDVVVDKGGDDTNLQAVIAAQKKRITELEEQNLRFKGVLRV